MSCSISMEAAVYGTNVSVNAVGAVRCEEEQAVFSRTSAAVVLQC